MVVEITALDYEAVGLARYPTELVLFDLEGVGGNTIGWTRGFMESC